MFKVELSVPRRKIQIMLSYGGLGPNRNPLEIPGTLWNGIPGVPSLETKTSGYTGSRMLSRTVLYYKLFITSVFT